MNDRDFLSELDVVEPGVAPLPGLKASLNAVR
jgi:hypothetical protein